MRRQPPPPVAFQTPLSLRRERGNGCRDTGKGGGKPRPYTLLSYSPSPFRGGGAPGRQPGWGLECYNAFLPFLQRSSFLQRFAPLILALLFLTLVVRPARSQGKGSFVVPSRHLNLCTTRSTKKSMPTVGNKGAGVIVNSVTAIDPLTGAVGPSVFVGDAPGGMVLSAGSRYLFVTVNEGGNVRRVDLPGMTPGPLYPMPGNRLAPCCFSPATRRLLSPCGQTQIGTTTPSNLQKRATDWGGGGLRGFGSDGNRADAPLYVPGTIVLMGLRWIRCDERRRPTFQSFPVRHVRRGRVLWQYERPTALRSGNH